MDTIELTVWLNRKKSLTLLFPREQKELIYTPSALMNPMIEIKMERLGKPKIESCRVCGERYITSNDKKEEIK